MDYGRFGSFPIKVLLYIVACVVLSPAVVHSADWDRDGARQSFLQAEKQYKELADTSDAALEDYVHCARTFRKVYFKDPHYARSGDAIYLEGLVYQKMGDIFAKESYYRLAVKRFEFLVSDYGGNPNCRDALRRTAELYSQKLKDADRAAQAQQLLRTYSRSDRNKPAASPDSVPGRKATRSSGTNARANTRSIVRSIRHWDAADHIRLEIGLDSDVRYKKNIVHDPERVYFDIKNATLSEELHDKVFDIKDASLKHVRAGQYRPDVVRVVLDFSSLTSYSVSELKDPFRIVVDVRHAPQPQKKTPELQTAKSELPEKQKIPENKKTAGNAAGKEPLPESASAPVIHPEGEAVAFLEGKTVPLGDLLHKDLPDSPKPAEPTSGGDRTLTRVLGLKIGKIVIDPGHGGHDFGTVGPGGMLEKDLVLKLSFRLKRLLEENLGAEVILTRDKDIFVSLEERTEIANRNKADLFISIHANSSRYRSISGVETYYLDFAKSDSDRVVAARENAGTGNSISDLESLVEQIALADKSTESKELASVIQNKLYRGAHSFLPATKNRGVRSAPFIVLIGAKMPSILTEVAFISNPRDEKKLKDENSLNQLAESLFSGIEAYIKKLGSYPIAYQAVQNK